MASLWPADALKGVAFCNMAAITQPHAHVQTARQACRTVCLHFAWSFGLLA
ncbi:hypothetical protein LOZ80_05460 [Paenibacillus sp. HWE-109]|uniref:hypothetical protein n=1 Tax=Paenibacillus sp. HWE-109 TaxID=1306526 RepID=UPI001EDE8DE2|nr:hypothetical protein [Paenibacillus sp. HWE-109]UKS28384.1 hypothetical protein LOZ80_05460 [Paenibacillus sp. HWE-109]